METWPCDNGRRPDVVSINGDLTTWGWMVTWQLWGWTETQPCEEGWRPDHVRIEGDLTMWVRMELWPCENGWSFDHVRIEGDLTMWRWMDTWPCEDGWTPDRVNLIMSLDGRNSHWWVYYRKLSIADGDAMDDQGCVKCEMCHIRRKLPPVVTRGAISTIAVGLKTEQQPNCISASNSWWAFKQSDRFGFGWTRENFNRLKSSILRNELNSSISSDLCHIFDRFFQVIFYWSLRPQDNILNIDHHNNADVTGTPANHLPV